MEQTAVLSTASGGSLAVHLSWSSHSAFWGVRTTPCRHPSTPAKRGRTSPRAALVTRKPGAPQGPPQEAPPAENFALRGNFRGVSQEQPQEVECAVKGRIPEELKGRLLRNGPNPYLPPGNPKQYHWFDGDGMIHSVHVDGEKNRAFYSCAWIRTAGFLEEEAAQRALHRGMLGGWGPENWRVLLTKASGIRLRDSPWWNGQKNTSNTHLVEHAGKLLSLSEGGYPYEVDPTTLETRGLYMFNNELRWNFTAHPKIDPQTGEMMFIGYNLVSQPHLHYGVVSKEGRIVHTADVRLPAPVMMHDFAITPRFTVLPDFPVRFRINDIVISQGKARPFGFYADIPGRIGVMPRFGGPKDIQWFEVASGACMHILNAYEEVNINGDTVVVLQGHRFNAITALGSVEVFGLKDFDESCYLHEWRLHLPSGTATERPLCSYSSDFPALDSSKLGTKVQYGFSARFLKQPGPGTDPPLFDGILKHHLATGASETFSFGAKRYGHEPVFVHRQSSSSSTEDVPRGDEGWLLVHVFDEEKLRSEMLILDAVSMKPVAAITVPKRVPYGFHGMFVHDK